MDIVATAMKIRWNPHARLEYLQGRGKESKQCEHLRSYPIWTSMANTADFVQSRTVLSYPREPLQWNCLQNRAIHHIVCPNSSITRQISVN